MSIIKVNQLVATSDNNFEIVMPPDTGGNVTRLNVNGTLTMDNGSEFVIPVGTTAQRPTTPVAGMIRINTDRLLGRSILEVYDGTSWAIVERGTTAALGQSGDTIITDGLVVYLDANIGSSYSSGASTWFDLSGNNNHFTLYNNPTQDVADKSISFSGASSQYARSTGTIDLSGASAVTVEVASKINSYAANAMIFEHTADWNTNSGAFGAFFNSKGGLSNSPDTDNWIHTNSQNSRVDFRVNSVLSYGFYSYIFQRGQVTRCFYNGAEVTQTLSPSSSNTANYSNDFTYLASRGGVSFHTDNDNSRTLDIGYFRIYNRALSTSEISDNYENSRTTYGL